MAKKKLLFIYGPLNPGGAERVFLDLLNHINYNKYEVDVCLYVNKGKLLNQLPKEIKLIWLWESYTLAYKLAYRFSVYFGFHGLLRKKIQKKIKTHYDYEVNFLEGMPLKIHGLMNSRGFKISWVHCDIFNDRYEASNFHKNEELQAYLKMNKIVCVSKQTKSAFLKRFNINQNKVEVIYNPIDTHNIKKKADEFQLKRSKGFNVVIVGRLEPQKRVDRLIELAFLSKKNKIDAHFHIVGDGSQKNELWGITKQKEVEDVVTFHGYQYNPYPYIKNSDLLISTSDFEGFGLVLCEAMVLGVPVISTKTAGPTEILEEDKYGILTNQDASLIYQAFEKMYQDQKLREFYIKQGLQRVEDYKIEKFMSKIEQLFDSN